MYEKYIKRTIDIMVVCLAFLILWPVYVIVAILVRCKLGSPVLFKQDRPGKNEKIFTLCKFRTMTSETDEEGNLLPDEVRLTTFGKFLRSSSLDELPELWNILRGDMSFIGPRPLLIKYLPYYNKEEQLRHTVRPGLTGLAQINGRNAIGWEERFAYDITYVKNCSIKMDLSVIFMTIPKVLLKSDVLSGEAQTTIDFDLYRKEQQGEVTE